MKTVEAHEAEAHLEELLDEVAAGEEIIVARAGKPCAKLVPLEKSTTKRRTFGLYPGHVPDEFFEPLSAEDIAAWEGNWSPGAK